MKMEDHLLYSLDSKGIKLTPMMEQYWSIKKLQMDKILFFRMGDFYEVFFQDAHVCAKALNITLTHRGKIEDNPIPMAGIPHHAANAYVDKLVGQGMKVAICEQVEDPALSKGIVKRAITQICTPVMPYDIDRTESSAENFLLSLKFDSKNKEHTSGWMVAIDFMHGTFRAIELKNREEILDFLELVRPKEFLNCTTYPQLDSVIEDALKNMGCLCTLIGPDGLDPKISNSDLEKIIPNFKNDSFLKQNPDLLEILRLQAFYIVATQNPTALQQIRPLKVIQKKEQLQLNAKTYYHLEILPQKNFQWNEYKQDTSLFHFMNATQTSTGTRLLREWFLSPLINKVQIEKRQNTVKHFLDSQLVDLQEVRRLLSPMRDIARILTKLSSGKISAQDLINLSQTIDYFQSLHDLLAPSLKDLNFSCELEKSEIDQLHQFSKLIHDSINEELRASIDNGNLIKIGFHGHRDELANIHLTINEKISKLEEKYRTEYQLPTLRIKSNNLNGYFIEISKGQSHKAPTNFQKVQTLTNGERFSSPELSKIEDSLVNAQEKLKKLEREIFETIKEQLFQISSLLKQMNEWISQIDAIQSLAFVALRENFVQPLLSDKKEFKVEGAWHPIIKKNLQGNFVSHNISMTTQKGLLLITGPNMAGKTTVMREAALIQFLFQIGSFVPAESATLSIADKIFCRVGAQDDIHHGQSTFMVEMSETAEILRHATKDSLILFDEIGRGTSTYDGLSIAWSLLEYLASELKSFTFFSTHYHELVELAESLPYAKNMTVKTLVDQDQIKFLYEFVEGGAKQSFGIRVAHMAGIPKEITKRAEVILHQLEQTHGINNEAKSKKSISTLTKNGAQQFELFPDLTIKNGTEKKNKHDKSDQLNQKIKSIDINHLTPMQALKKLEEIQRSL
ncbi:MAG: DNA mismatch repair protein MutS [Bacteriovoracaceae bacterium]|nr:DNA mismatch repair protein MutS [Bacteriovoracaceae bacterium]